jgi:hypothetical protein
MDLQLPVVGISSLPLLCQFRTAKLIQKQNQLINVIETSYNAMSNAFEILLQQRQLAESLE